jgi:hypothetical protein
LAASRRTFPYVKSKPRNFAYACGKLQAWGYGDSELDRAVGQITGWRPAMTGPRLSIEQRRALVMLATAGRDGMTQPSLAALGFDASTIAGLVNKGIATQTLSRGRAGGKMVSRVRIKAAGRRAIKG